MKNLSTPTLDKQLPAPESAYFHLVRAQLANVFGADCVERNPHSKIAQNRRGAITGKLSGTKTRFSRGKRARNVQIFPSSSTLSFCKNKKLQFPSGNSGFAEMILKPRGEIETGEIKNLRENRTFCLWRSTRNCTFVRRALRCDGVPDDHGTNDFALDFQYAEFSLRRGPIANEFTNSHATPDCREIKIVDSDTPFRSQSIHPHSLLAERFNMNRALVCRLGLFSNSIALLATMAITGWSSPAAAQTAARNFKFEFGVDKATGDAKLIQPSTTYTSELGYGFESGAKVNDVQIDREGKSSISRCIAGDKPFYFSVKLPEGNYKVTAKLGNPNADTKATVRAELRRLMLQDVAAAKNLPVEKTFIVNVRTPKIPGGGEVKLTGRETSSEIWAWDDKLTLEFNGEHPSIASLEIEPADDVPTVYIIGDSTVCDQGAEPWNSWGQMITRFFKPEVAVANHSESGESLRGAQGKRRLDKILSQLKPGDYVFVQFGHNDMKEKGAGVGAETSYKTEMKKFVSAVKAKQATPVVVTSVNRKTLDRDGKVTNSFINANGDYIAAAREAAQEEGAALVDLNALSKQLYEAIGREEISKLFVDNTHHNNYGSYEIAKCVAKGIKDAKLDLAKYLVPEVQDFDPNHPDPISQFKMPPSPKRDPSKPEGS
jgi:lysophospholipase L1-like esterase